MTARRAILLVAGREFTQTVRDRAFLISSGLTLAIVIAVAVLPSALGAGGDTTYRVGVADHDAAAVAEAARQVAPAFDADIEVTGVPAREADAALRDDRVDVVLTREGVRSLDEPEDDLLYGQIFAFGFLVASGVVQEKASRVVEVILAAVRPTHLLAGKVIGLGLLGLAQLLLTVLIGLAAAVAVGAVDLDGDLVAAALLSLAWFLLGYAFYACAFACAGALVPRHDELQAAVTPLTTIILVSFFLSFAAVDDPGGTLARVTSFIPFAAPLTMPPRIALGEAPAGEIVAALVITAAAAAALVPIAARIYSGAVLRTGSAMKLREAWRAAARG